MKLIKIHLLKVEIVMYRVGCCGIEAGLDVKILQTASATL